jgi:hypothetical protein
VPINGWLHDLKFGRNRVYHKVKAPRGRTNILRNCRLSASTAFRTIDNQGNSGIRGHTCSIGRWFALSLS